MFVDKKTGEIFNKTKTGRRSKAFVKGSILSSSAQQARIANKVDKYWASMRTNMALLGRAKDFDRSDQDKVREELQSILDQGILSYPPTLKEIGLSPDQTLDEKKELLGIQKYLAPRSREEELFLKDAANKALACRKADWTWRVAQEAEEKHKLGWHPFFVTLTVDRNKADPEEIWRNPKYFRKYIRKLAKVVCKELKHKPPHKHPYRPESDYVTYVGVVEHGKSRKHHHGHFLIWLRAIPSNWSVDPNLGRRPERCTENECRPMSAMWKWRGYAGDGTCLSPALYFRSVDDIWEKSYNFVLPLRDGEPMKVAVPAVAGSYIVKYLQKEHREWKHRMKATRNLGMKKIKEVIQNLDKTVVEALTWRPEKSSLALSLMKTHSAPLGLVRLLAKQQHFLNLYQERRLDLRMLLEQKCGIFMRMLRDVKRGARPERMHSHQYYDWVSKHLPVQREYSEVRLIAAHCLLIENFPPRVPIVEHKKLGANTK